MFYFNSTDAHLVFESDDRLLPHAATGFSERSVPFSPGTPQTLHHPLIYWHHSGSVIRQLLHRSIIHHLPAHSLSLSLSLALSLRLVFRRIINNDDCYTTTAMHVMSRQSGLSSRVPSTTAVIIVVGFNCLSIQIPRNFK